VALDVGPGNHSTGSGPEAPQRRSGQAVCPIGSYCTRGVAVLCPVGRYGALPGLDAPACSGSCAPGYACLAGSVTATASLCPAGYFCSGGTPEPCPPGSYLDTMGATANTSCVPCGPGRYSSIAGASTASACTLCAAGEGSEAGAADCWPGIVSVLASNPPPLLVGLSVGDVITVLFTKATDAPPFTPSIVSFIPSIGGIVAAWRQGGRELQLVVTNTSGVNTSAVDVATGSVRMTVGGVRSAGAGALSLLPPTTVTVGGTWGSPSAPSIVVAAATGAGQSAGLGTGDSLLLVFDQVVQQVGVDSSAAVSALLAFTPPLPLGVVTVVGAWVNQTSLSLQLTCDEAAWGQVDRSQWAVGRLVVTILSGGGSP
jgi:hypothetical protein